MGDRFDELARQLRDRVLFGQGTLDSEIRSAAADGRGVPIELSPHVEKVQQHAYKVMDEDFEDLLHAGYSEDQIFELTVCAAVGAGFRRLELALAALQMEG